MKLQIKVKGSAYLKNGTNLIEFPISNPKHIKIKKLIVDMEETLYSTLDGVGLAAPQVGKKERIFIVQYDGFDEVFINPQINYYSGIKDNMYESCLSCPGALVLVERPTQIQVQYYDRNFKNQILNASDMLARIIQHEYDHLKGKIITDYV